MCFVVALGVALVARSPSARAQAVDDATRGAARQLGYSGVEAYQAGDFKTASVRLEKAYLVLRVPSLGLWSARALVKIRKLVEARERYTDIASLPVEGGDATVQEEAKRDAKIELADLAPRVPNLVVVLEGAQPNEVTVFVDGLPLAAALIGEKRPVNPGRHRIGGRRGNDQANLEVEVTEGEVENAILRFGASTQPAANVAPVAGGSASAPGSPSTDEPTAPSSSRRLIAWVAIGVGAAGIATGGVTGALVLSKQGDLERNENCRDEQCSPNARDQVGSYNTLRIVSGTAFIAGAVIAGAGVVLLATSPRTERPRAALILGPASLAVRGQF